jgi:hypothetical protein
LRVEVRGGRRHQCEAGVIAAVAGRQQEQTASFSILDNGAGNAIGGNPADVQENGHCGDWPRAES